MFEFEEWKPIEGYEGLYELRNDGLLHSLPRPHRRIEYTYGRNDGKSYLQCTLSKNGVGVCKKMHILVYETFVGEVPNGYDVHHINHNRQDNRIENLCLVEHSKHTKLHNPQKHTIQIFQYTLDGEFVAEYESAVEASKATKINASHIRGCCNGKRKTAGGFIWKNKKAA